MNRFVILPNLGESQHTGSSFNYGAEPKIKNLQTGKFLCRWIISLHIHHCGDPLAVLFLYDKIRQLEPGTSDVIFWKIPSVKFVFDSAKVARPSSDPLIEPATSFSSSIFRTHPMEITSSSNSTPMVLDPLRASVLQFYSPSSLEITTIFSNGPSQNSSTLVFEINWTQWTPGWIQSDLTKTQLTRSPQCQRKLESQQS